MRWKCKKILFLSLLQLFDERERRRWRMRIRKLILQVTEKMSWSSVVEIWAWNVAGQFFAIVCVVHSLYLCVTDATVTITVCGCVCCWCFTQEKKEQKWVTKEK